MPTEQQQNQLDKSHWPTPVELFNIPVQAMSKSQALDEVHRVIERKESLHFGMLNAAKVINMGRNRQLNEAVLSSDLILADGSAIVMASKLLKKPLPERVAGIDLMHGIFERGSQHGYRVYCLGATEEVSQKVADKLKQDYPGVILAGRRNGYFSDAEEEAVAQDIANAKPDVLLVAITSPKKEQFMSRWSKLVQVPVVHGVGGSFDVMAGKVKRAPESWQKYGLEWLYRVKQEPGRMWKRYLITNSLFCWLLLKTYTSERLLSSKS